MKRISVKAAYFFLALGLSFSLSAQTVDKAILNWYNGVKPGMGTEKAYKLVSKRTPKEVVVAIIDSGVDIEHEDLKGQIWINSDEIAGNGKDDDKNGYIDDVHGWNFLGNVKGENANDENLEFVRIYKRWKPVFDGKSESEIPSANKADFALWQECKDKLESERADAEANLQTYSMLRDQIIPMLPSIVKKSMKVESYTLKDLLKWKPDNDNDRQIQALAIQVESGELSSEQMDEGIKHFKDQLEFNLNPDFDGRALVGDNPYDLNDRNYGNSDVEGPDALHGTHVAGIVAAVRGNNLGGDGVASAVKIMSLRAVPNGDEYDKDIALAIRYAADNGASIINMSFGKSYSPQQKEVYDAMMYAQGKGVLLVHAAGNDASNVDVTPNYPSCRYSFQSEDFTHLLTIGASTRFTKGMLAASFSNYGKKSVDIFAPGFEIYNTVPDNKYRKLQGTSMAAPAVSGVAAWLKSYFPELSMLQIKDIMLKSATSYAKTMQVKPGAQDKVAFGDLSVTGGVVNVEAAAKMAIKASATAK